MPTARAKRRQNRAQRSHCDEQRLDAEPICHPPLITQFLYERDRWNICRWVGRFGEAIEQNICEGCIVEHDHQRGDKYSSDQERSSCPLVLGADRPDQSEVAEHTHQRDRHSEVAEQRQRQYDCCDRKDLRPLKVAGVQRQHGQEQEPHALPKNVRELAD